MEKKPIIGITCNYDYRDTVGIAGAMGAVGQDWNYVTGDYIYALEKAGASPLVIPRCKDAANLEPMLASLDGILITGGHDVTPVHYGEPKKSYCGLVIPARDRYDLAVAKFAFEHNKPVLGICRGNQIINVARGGSLYQDIEKDGNFNSHSYDLAERNAAVHPVKIDKSSLIYQAVGQEELWVNSFHHQAVKEPGEGVKVVAVSYDGLTEAIEVEGYKFAVGLQWHPEMMFDSELHQKLIDAFVEACR